MRTPNQPSTNLPAEMARRYVVVSPVKNEAAYLPATIASMTAQTILPVAWVLVNDGSQDDTPVIIAEQAGLHPWIRLVNRPGSAVRRRGVGVVEAFYAGFDSLDVAYDFIVKLDGDVSFEANYFEGLLWQFGLDEHLGIAGGGLYEMPDGKTWKLNTNESHVRGATKVYRRACFEAIGGLSPSMGWDGIDEWKALAQGWKVRSFLNLKLMHYRYTGAATGHLKSFYEQGYGAYRMCYHPLYITARGLRRMTDQPVVIGGLAMMWAYLWAWLRREPKLADASVERYIRKAQMRSLWGRFAPKNISHGG